MLATETVSAMVWRYSKIKEKLAEQESQNHNYKIKIAHLYELADKQLQEYQNEKEIIQKEQI